MKMTIVSTVDSTHRERGVFGYAAALRCMLAVVLASAGVAQGQDSTAASKGDAATADKIEFARIQDECQQGGALSFWPHGKWSSCRVLRSGFVATIGLQDFYFAQYCLGGTTERCDSLAQVVFRNRAYKSEAHLEMVRIDPVGTVYERPILVGSENASALVIAARQPGQRAIERTYYRRNAETWAPMDARAWLADLQARLPQGLSIRAGAQPMLPDPHTMAVRVPLYRSADRDCCASGGSAQVQLNVEEGRLQVADLKLVRGEK